MDILTATELFSTLSQGTRLSAFRLLVKAGEKGLPAGQLSDALQIPQNTMSFHLNHLANAGIVSSVREGRSIIYKANFALMTDLIQFMVKDCCISDYAVLDDSGSYGEDKACCVVRVGACHTSKQNT